MRKIFSEEDEVFILGERLDQNLKVDSYYERMRDTANAEEKISSVFGEEYKKVHGERTEAYIKAVDEIKGVSEWAAIPEESQKSILSPFANRICEEIIFEEKDTVCRKCGAVYSQIESDVAAVDGLKRKALKKIIEITFSEGKEKVEHVRIASFFSGAIQSEEDLKEGIEQFQNHIQKLLAKGKTIILE